MFLSSGITTVLTLAFLNIDNRKDLPEVSYSTALDYFVGTCFGFVMVSIIQFSGVHFFTKHGGGQAAAAPESDSEGEWSCVSDASSANCLKVADLSSRTKCVA